MDRESWGLVFAATLFIIVSTINKLNIPSMFIEFAGYADILLFIGIGIWTGLFVYNYKEIRKFVKI
jgi:hypothetical protein